MLLEIYLEKEKSKIHFSPPFFILARMPFSPRWPSPLFFLLPCAPRQPSKAPAHSGGQATASAPRPGKPRQPNSSATVVPFPVLSR